MNQEIKTLLEKHDRHEKLSVEDIRALMYFALELLDQFEIETEKSIARAQELIRLKYEPN